MTPRQKLLLALAAGCLVLSAATVSFIAFHDTSRDDDEPIRAPQRVSSQHGDTVITIDPAMQRMSGIQTLQLKNTSWTQPLRAYGIVLDVEPLIDLAHRCVAAREQVEAARARLAASQLAFERASKLFKDQQNVSSAQLQASETAYRADRAGFNTAQSELDTLAATAQQSWGAELGEAAMQGLHPTKGPNTPRETPLLTRLAQRQELLLQVTLRPGEIPAPSPTEAFVQMDDGSHVTLRYVSLAPRTDPRIQGVSLFFTAPRMPGLLPGMNVLVSLPTARTVQGAIVPQSAVVWMHGSAWAYIRSGASQFVRHSIPTDAPMPAGYGVRDLPDDAEVVVQGAQMLLSEEHRAEARVTD
jgi:hypothetical protein